MKISGCNDCNKVIDCKTPEDTVAVEVLEGKACSWTYSRDRSEHFGEDYYGDLKCYAKCIGKDKCFCETKMIYQEGKPVPDGFLIFDNDNGPQGAMQLGCVLDSADAEPLQFSSAFAGSSTSTRFFSLYYDTKEKDLCNITQCWRKGKCCDILRRSGGNAICPVRC